MSNIDSKAKKSINQTELRKLLNLTLSASKYIKDNNIIEWKKLVGKSFSITPQSNDFSNRSPVIDTR